ncbi:ABC transporter substrate-binding protein [Noviherbaspirillum sp.]|uniref:ABC transporter substrate-binding protein n=1 Tax=Noviherbaspirillum sp. TaxID=1926288 RepID=UPI002FE0B072
MRFLQTFTLVLALLSADYASAAEIVIGQVASLGNPDSAGPHIRIGLKAYFDAINATGGVHGATLKFVSKDRGANVADSVSKTRELLAESQPTVLTGFMGTGSMELIIKSKLLEEADIPVVGIRTGDLSLHEPVNPYLFHTRANYLGEIEKIVTQLATIGLKNVAVFSEKSPFGNETLALIQGAIKKDSSMKLIHHATYAANTVDVNAAAKSISDVKPQGVIVVANSAAAAEFYKTFREQGGKAQVIALSVADGVEVVKRIGEKTARGLIVTQVVPDPNTALPLVRELKMNLAKYAPSGTPLNLAVVEGYVMAKTVVQALRLAGPNPSRRKVRIALESMKEFDAGGVIIGYSPKNHTGSKYVELAIVLASGKLMR